MPQSQANFEVTDLSGGFVTEANPLNFPPNAVRDMENMLIEDDGSVSRRKGLLVFSGGPGGGGQSAQSSALRVEPINNVGSGRGKGAVIVWGGDVYVLDFSAASPFSAYVATFTSNTNARAYYIDGALFIVDYLQKNIKRTNISGSPGESVYSVNIRDFGSVVYSDQWIESNIDFGARNANYYRALYMLKNAGWTDDSITDFQTQASNTNLLPSLNSSPQYAKDSNQNLDWSLVEKQFFGNALAPNGKVIFDIFNPGPGREAIVPQLAAGGTVAQAGVNDIANYAGRIFYCFSQTTNWTTEADTSDLPNLRTIIAFSQVATSPKNYGRCYQYADPTSEHISDLVATDGGTISIPEASDIVRLIPLSTSLLAFAKNGVWEITGGAGGFSATDYSVNKVTSYGVESPESIVVVGDIAYYWSRDGICAITREQVSGNYQAQVISDPIESFYLGINTLAKQFAAAAYDPSRREIVWQYNDSSYLTETQYRYVYNKELRLKLQTGAYQKISYPVDGTNWIGPCFAAPTATVLAEVDNVVAGSDSVVAGADTVVVPIDETDNLGGYTMVYLRPVGDILYMSAWIDDTFVDFGTTDAPAYMLTGHYSLGDTQRRKQAKYLTVHSFRTETGFVQSGNGLEPVNPSSVKIQPRWDFADSERGGKIGSEFEAYRLTRPYIPSGPGDQFDYGQELITTKNKLRGSGSVLQLRFSSSPGKDMKVKGWALNMTGNTNV